MSELWHDAREIPQSERTILLMLLDGGFKVAYLIEDSEWLPFVNKVSKWLYCDELIPREHPKEFGVEFLEQLQKDCSFASRELAKAPAKNNRKRNLSGALLGVELEIPNVIWDMKK